jgi:suppressor of G2 allele of SKP1
MDQEKKAEVGENQKVEDGNANKEPQEVVVKPPPNIRRDFYQTESDFVLTILAKNVNPKDLTVDFGPQTLEVHAKLPDGEDYELKTNLFAPIRPEACSYSVTRSKIEIRLRKDSASTWPALECVEKKVFSAPPVYPSSSKNKKNWDKVEKEIEAETKDDDADINSLFAKIYNSGDEDMKKAMIKSMQESGGTVLSTNWSEVGKKKVDISPPDGMEWKKWDDVP